MVLGSELDQGRVGTGSETKVQRGSRRGVGGVTEVRKEDLYHTVQTTCGVLSTYWGLVSRGRSRPHAGSSTPIGVRGRFRTRIPISENRRFGSGYRGSSGIDTEVVGGGSEGYRDCANIDGLGFNLCVALCNDSRPYLQSVDSEVGVGSGPGRDQIGVELETKCGGEDGGVIGGVN